MSSRSANFLRSGAEIALLIAIVSGCGLTKDDKDASSKNQNDDSELVQKQDSLPTSEKISETVQDLGTKPIISSVGEALDVSIEKIEAPKFRETAANEFPVKSLFVIEKWAENKFEVIDQVNSRGVQTEIDCKIPQPTGPGKDVPKDWRTFYGDFRKVGDSYSFFVYSSEFEVRSSSYSGDGERRVQIALCSGDQSDSEWQKVVVSRTIDKSDYTFQLHRLDSVLMPNGDLHLYDMVSQAKNGARETHLRRSVIKSSGDHKTENIYVMPVEWTKGKILSNSDVAVNRSGSVAVFLEFKNDNERKIYLLRIKEGEISIKVLASAFDCSRPRLYWKADDKLSLACAGKFNGHEGLISLNENGSGGFLRFQPFFDSDFWGVQDGELAVTVVENFGSVGYVAKLDDESGWVKRDFVVNAKLESGSKVSILNGCVSESSDDRMACRAKAFSGDANEGLSILVLQGEKQTLFPWPADYTLKKMEFLQ